MLEKRKVREESESGAGRVFYLPPQNGCDSTLQEWEVLLLYWCVMRRVYAMILLIPVLTLFAGSVTLASSCAKMPAGMECGRIDKAKGKWIMDASHETCGGRSGRCGQQCHKEQKGKNEKKEKDDSGYCIDCPLCCLVTFSSFFRWEFSREVTTIDYTVMSDNNLSDYFQRHWKPPAGSFLT
jgi:hypothetical protein